MKWDNVYDEQKNIPTNEALQWGIPVDEVSDLGVQYLIFITASGFMWVPKLEIPASMGGLP